MSALPPKSGHRSIYEYTPWRRHKGTAFPDAGRLAGSCCAGMRLSNISRAPTREQVERSAASWHCAPMHRRTADG